MNMLNSERLDEELLREHACNGDLLQIRQLLTKQPELNLNSQNAMNGWTALHWAAKRNHRQIVEYLLQHGADKDIEAHDKSTAAQVCKDDSLKRILESSESAISSSTVNEVTLPIIPSYLRHPVFPYAPPESMSNSTTTITFNSQEVTLLCRVADNPSETDFVEFDFNKSPNEGSYDRLVSIICQELNIQHVDKLRRLPYIRVRNDRDVERLKDNHMLEAILINKS